MDIYYTVLESVLLNQLGHEFYYMFLGHKVKIFAFNTPVELLITPWVLCNSIILTLWHS